MRCVGSEFAVGAAFELAEKRETREILLVDHSHFEYVVRAHFDAVALSFAGVAVNYRAIRARCCSTFFSRALGVFRGATSFLGI
jgi:hypothetical protein